MPRKMKKNAQGAGTIRKRSDGRWEARYTTGFDPTTGRQIQRSIYGKTQKEVRERLAGKRQIEGNLPPSDRIKARKSQEEGYECEE